MADKKIQTKPLTLEERLLEKSVKQIEKQVGEQTNNRLQAGQSPKQILSELLQSIGGENITQQDVLNQINTLASQKVPTEGTITGIIPALLNTAKGQGFHPFSPKQAPMGVDTATKIMQMQQSMQQQAGQVPKTQTELLKNLIDISKSTGNQALFEAAGGQIIPEIDWRTGQPSLEAKIGEKKALTTAQTEAKSEAERKGQTERLSKDLENYFAIGDLLPTEEGIARYRKGFELFGKRIAQSDIIGAAAADLDAINKRLRVRIVKYNGDVGNINIVEQKAAEKILYSLSDSTKLRALKKAYLTDLTTATMRDDGGAVRALIRSYINEPEFQVKYPDVYKTYQKQQLKQEKQNQPVEDFSKMTTEQLLERRNKLLRGGK